MEEWKKDVEILLAALVDAFDKRDPTLKQLSFLCKEIKKSIEALEVRVGTIENNLGSH